MKPGAGACALASEQRRRDWPIAKIKEPSILYASLSWMEFSEWTSGLVLSPFNEVAAAEVPIRECIAREQPEQQESGCQQAPWLKDHGGIDCLDH